MGRDSAHIVITPSLSDIYAWPLMLTSDYTLSEFTPQYLWSIQFIAHTVWPVICQGSMHCGASSGLDILIGKQGLLGDCLLGLVQIIITPLLSDIYAWSLMSASGYTSSESTP